MPPKEDTPRPRADEKLQQDCIWDTISLKIKPHTCQKLSEGANKTLCATGPRKRGSDPHKRLSQICL